jgi:hypothetical protein
VAKRSIEQPNPDQIERAACPPVKDWAILSFHGWVPRIFGEVSIAFQNSYVRELTMDASYPLQLSGDFG